MYWWLIFNFITCVIFHTGKQDWLNSDRILGIGCNNIIIKQGSYSKHTRALPFALHDMIPNTMVCGKLTCSSAYSLAPSAFPSSQNFVVQWSCNGFWKYCSRSTSFSASPVTRKTKQNQHHKHTMLRRTTRVCIYTLHSHSLMCSLKASKVSSVLR